MGLDLPLLDKLQLKRGDELHFQPAAQPISNRVQSKIGYKISTAAVTDFIFFGIGMLIGMLIGMIQFRFWGISDFRSAVAAVVLLSGLFFGWLRSVHPNFCGIAGPAPRIFLRDFRSGRVCRHRRQSRQARKRWSPSSITVSRCSFLGVGVTLIPQIITFFFSYYVLRIQNPIEALACVAGGRSANPAFAALLVKGRQRHAGGFIHGHLCRRQRIPHAVGAP